MVALKAGLAAKRKFKSPAPGMGISFFCLQNVGRFLWNLSRNIFRHLQFTNWKEGLEDRIEDGEH